ncbi:MAG: hypothetical protein WBG47_07735, partial [Gordonia sp. (in: high G+C Gram-positive bacteria)]|uniref:hypothetical protein n=1 Tax=Gordonia sp. (in: high G+C Gram-positive bacteria) TaxID=84139 RepID=UPI003C7683DD
MAIGTHLGVIGVLLCCVAIGLVADDLSGGVVGVISVIAATALAVVSPNVPVGDGLTLMPVFAAVGGFGWAFARHRDLVPSLLAAAVGAAVGGLLMVMIGMSQIGFGVIGVLAPVLTAWFAAALCPRSAMTFRTRPVLNAKHSRPVVVGYTANGEPVYAAAVAPGAQGSNGLAIGSFVC